MGFHLLEDLRGLPSSANFGEYALWLRQTSAAPRYSFFVCLIPKISAPHDALRRCFNKLEQEITARIDQAKLAA